MEFDVVDDADADDDERRRRLMATLKFTRVFSVLTLQP